MTKTFFREALKPLLKLIIIKVVKEYLQLLITQEPSQNGIFSWDVFTNFSKNVSHWRVIHCFAEIYLDIYRSVVYQKCGKNETN